MKNNIDILHVHDLYLLPTTLKVAQQHNIPVIADLHENLPAAFRAYRTTFPFYRRILSAIKNNYWMMRNYEKNALKKCIRTIIVVPEAAERIYKYGIPQEQVKIVSNTEDETTFNFDPTTLDPTIIEAYNHYWVASYIGNVGPHRGLDTTLYALPKVLQYIPNFKLLIIGVNDEYHRWITKLATDLGINEMIEVIGWVSFQKVNSYVMASDVCLVPHNDFEHTQTTIPHKLFQYMICKRPVLVSNCKPLERVVKDTKAGCIFKVNQPEDMADQLIWMYSHPKECKEMGEHGQRAALDAYSWKQDAMSLVNIYRDLEMIL